MTNILHLSSKILNNLLRYTDVSVEDVINLSLTCKQLQLQIRDEEFWRYKFFQRWPSLKDVCEIKWINREINVKNEVLTRLKCRSKLLHYIDLLYQRYYDIDDLTADDMKDFNVEFCKKQGAHFMHIYYLEDELLNNVNLNPANQNTNLRVMYYSMKLLMYMRNYRLKEKWEKFNSQPSQQQLLENVFTMFLQYSQFFNYVSTKTVMDSVLNKLVIKTITFLKKMFPNHSLFVSKKPFYVWIGYNIKHNYWNGSESLQILSSVNTVICKEIKRLVHYQNTIIFRVFKTIMFLFERSGRALYFAAIFHVVARRLGVRCDIKYYNYGAHALIWKADYKSNSIKGNCYYIDIYDEHMSDAHSSIADISASDLIADHITITPSQLMLSLSERIQFSEPYGVSVKKHICKEIKDLILPPDVNSILKVPHISKNHNMNLTPVTPLMNGAELIKTLNDKLLHENLSEDEKSQIIKLLDKINKINLQVPTIINVRTRNIKYAIGMIMECTMSESCTVAGVIYGWDIERNIKKITNTHGEIIFTNTLCRTNKQPHYKILTTNQEFIYVPQDKIKPLINTVIYHTEIGRYFCYFKKTHYVPNSKLETKYPQDSIVRYKWLLTLARSSI